MRKSVPLLLTILLSQSVSANELTCGTPVSSSGSLVCSSCVYADQYAFAGAAVAQAKGLTSVLVRNRTGNTQTVVTLSPTSSGNSVIFGASVPFTLALNYMLSDRDHISVASVPIRGRPKGTSFPKQDVSKIALAAKCKVMEEKAEDEKNARDKAEALTSDYGVTSGMTYSEIRSFLRGRGPHNVRPPFRPDDCRNCTTESVPNSR